jgi:hypothetical protein
VGVEKDEGECKWREAKSVGLSSLYRVRNLRSPKNESKLARSRSQPVNIPSTGLHWHFTRDGGDDRFGWKVITHCVYVASQHGRQRLFREALMSYSLVSTRYNA